MVFLFLHKFEIDYTTEYLGIKCMFVGVTSHVTDVPFSTYIMYTVGHKSHVQILQFYRQVKLNMKSLPLYKTEHGNYMQVSWVTQCCIIDNAI